MNTETKTKNLFMRTTMTLLTMLLATAGAVAQTQYISEVILIGKNNNTEANTLKAQYVAQGWTAIDKDLNDGCGSKTDYIYLLYKTRTTASPNHTFITDFYISDATGDAPESLTYNGLHYTLVPYDGTTTSRRRRAT